jgi:uncharacterized membrane protein
MAELQQSSLDKTLLSWCQEATKVINPHTKLADWITGKNVISYDAIYACHLILIFFFSSHPGLR